MDLSPQLNLFETTRPLVEKTVTKTFFEKRYNVCRTTLVKMLKEVPGYKTSKTWYIHPNQAMQIINFYG